MSYASKKICGRVIAVIVAIILVTQAMPVNMLQIAAETNETGTITETVLDDEESSSEASEESSGPSEENSETTDESSETSEGEAESDEESSEASGGSSETGEESSEASEGSSDSSEDSSKASEDSAESSEGSSEPSAESSDSSEVSSDTTEEDEESSEPTEDSAESSEPEEELLDIPDDAYSVEDYNGVYNGEKHYAKVEVAEGYTVTYSTDGEEYSDDAPSIKNAGSETVYVKISAEGYEDKIVTVTLEVTKATRDDFKFKTEDDEEEGIKLVYKEGATRFTYGVTSIYEPMEKVVYTSSNEEIASVDEYGTVTFLKAGNVTITATMAESDNYIESIASYTITALQPRTGFGFAENDFTITYGDNDNTFTNVVNKTEEDVVEITYEIISQKRDNKEIAEDDAVATIDSATGEVTIITAGVIEVRATVAAGEYYAADEATYTLTIERAEQTGFKFTAETPLTMAYGDEATLAVEGGNGDGAVTYEVIAYNETVSDNYKKGKVVVEEDGKITAVSVGTATIKAIKAQDDKYIEATDEYEITVIKAEQSDFSFEKTSYSVSYGTKELTVVATGGQSEGAVTYTIVTTDESDPIATLEENTNKVIFKSEKIGTIKIKAVRAGDEFYNEVETEATIEVAAFDGSQLYSLNVKANDLGWYKERVEIVPDSGYMISDSNSFDATWKDKMIVDTEGINEEFSFYLKNISEETISNVIRIQEIKVDTTSPSDLMVTYSKANRSENIGDTTYNYYNKNIVVNLSAVDNVSGIEKFTYNLGNDTEDITIPKSNITETDGVYTATFEISEEYFGKVKCAAYDGAGHFIEKEETTVLCLDKTAPTALDIKINDRSITLSTEDEATFNTFFSDGVNAILSAEDNGGSGLASLTYQICDNFTEDLSDEWIQYSESAQIKIAQNKKVVIYFKAEDKAGNIDIVKSTGIIVDDKVPETVITPAKANENGFHNNDVNINVVVVEPTYRGSEASDTGYYSGLNKITYRVYDSKSSEELESGVLLDLSNALTDGAIVDSDTLISSWTGSITVDKEYNSNDIIVEVTAIDNAGNKHASSTNDGDIKIDIDPPEILNISYSKPEREIDNSKYYQESVTVTISATDNASGIDYFTYNLGDENGDIKLEKVDINGVPTATFVIDKEYSGSVSFTAYDCAENSTTRDEKQVEIIVDQTPPTELDILIDEKSVVENDENVYDTFYDATINIKLSANFDISGKQSIAYQIVTPASVYDKDGTWTEYDEETGIDVSPNTKFVLYMRAEDKAGNVSVINSTGILVDDKEPIGENGTTEITIIPKEANEKGFHNEDVEVDITVVEPKYLDGEVNDAGYYSGLNEITYRIYDAQSQEEFETGVLLSLSNVKTEGAAFDKDTLISSWSGSIIVDKEYNSNNIIVEVTAVDNAGNKRVSSTNDGDIKIDIDVPIISIEYSNNDVANEKYFKGYRYATITVTERNFDANRVTVNIIADNMAKGETVYDYEKHLQDINNWTRVNGVTYKTTIPFKTQAFYNVSIACTDLADNTLNQAKPVDDTKAPFEFVVDISDPIELDIMINDKSVVEKDERVYDTFHDAAINIKLSADFDISGKQSIAYQIVTPAVEYDEDGEWTEYNEETGITIFPNTKFVLYMKAVDMAGNFAIVNSTGIVVDNQNPIGENDTPEITIIPEESNENGFYNEDVEVDITVVDPKYLDGEANDAGYYSGLNEIRYRIYDAQSKEEFETGVLLSLSNVKTEGAVFDKDNLISSWSGSIVVDKEYNSNHIIVEVTAVDNAGNEKTSATSAGDIKIDIDDPIIKVSYDNNNVVNKQYFYDNRNATIIVEERNFDATKVVSGITASDYAEDAELFGYEAYLKEASNWKSEGIVHTIELPFETEAKYVFDIEVTDLADCVQEEIVFAEDSEATTEFVIDKTNPVIHVEYVNNDVRNGKYFKAGRTAVITITERNFDAAKMVSGITASDYAEEAEIFGYEAYLKEATNWRSEGIVHTIELPFETEAKYKFDIAVTDLAERKCDEEIFAEGSEAVTEFVIDKTKPIIHVGYKNNDVRNEKYFDAGRTAIITITERNFDAAKMISKITASDYAEEAEIFGYEAYLKEATNWKSEGIVHTIELPFETEANYKFDIEVTDLAERSCDEEIFAEGSEAVTEFVIDKTNPVIHVGYKNNDVRNGKYFDAGRTAVITITERNFDAAKMVSRITASDYAEKAEIFGYETYLKEATNWKSEGIAHTIELPFETEAKYVFDIQVTDLAERSCDEEIFAEESKAATEFTVDTSAPTKLDILIDEISLVEKDTIINYGTFYRVEKNIKLKADCNISGLKLLQYKIVLPIEDPDEVEWMNYSDSIGITVRPNTKFVLYMRVEDNAGNISFANSTGIVVDNQLPIGATEAPEIDIIPDEAGKIHNSNVDVAIKVVDPKYLGEAASENGYFAGLKDVRYKIFTSDTDDVEEGNLLEKLEEGIVKDDSGLIHSVEGKITVSAETFNSNNIIVEVTAIDNAGNEKVSRTDAGQILIDTTNPIIDIYYINNDVDGDVYFKENRTAVINITERNFSGSDVNISITNTDGVIPSVSSWSESGGTGNGDDTTWTATIDYTEDGDYVFGITYADLAGNVSGGAVYASGTIAPTEFTIDKTTPQIEVRYDNNSVQNGNYYNAERTATVVVKEHNFRADRVSVTMTATDDGVVASVPTVNGWTSNGDEHYATIRYANDARYTFDIAVKDSAGNDSTDFTEQIFYIDKTAPSLRFTGIENNSANSGEVIPIVTYSDTNYDADNVSITLTGANRGRADFDGVYSSIHNGRVFTFTNFAVEKDVDDIYTLTASLTDLAGNTSTETITFSVNRFGSAYEIDENTSKINGTYIKEPQDVVIAEVNANELNNIKITLFKNNETIILKEGVDYKIDVEGGNGEWYYYTYTIFKSNFEDDGVYRVSIHSEDAAGNIAENTLDTKDMEIGFGVDKTNPNIIVENLESGMTYAVEGITAKMSISDNLRLDSVVVYLDNYNAPYKSWTAEEITEIIAGNGEFSFDIAGDSASAHNVKIVCTDAAGNEQVEEIIEFFVTTNLLVRYVNNKPVFYGSTGGMGLLIGLTLFMILFKKKDNEEEE